MRHLTGTPINKPNTAPVCKSTNPHTSPPNRQHSRGHHAHPHPNHHHTYSLFFTHILPLFSHSLTHNPNTHRASSLTVMLTEVTTRAHSLACAAAAAAAKSAGARGLQMGEEARAAAAQAEAEGLRVSKRGLYLCVFCVLCLKCSQDCGFGDRWGVWG